MSDTHSHDASSHIGLYLGIGLALLIGTGITVYAAGIQMGVVVGVTVAVIIATVKGSLVAGYFMHLKDEVRAIYGLLALTAAFIVVMVGLFLFAFGDQQGVHRGAFLVPDGHVPAHVGQHTEIEHVP